MRLYRVIVYDGPEDLLETIIGRSLEGTWVEPSGLVMSAVTVYLHEHQYTPSEAVAAAFAGLGDPIQGRWKAREPKNNPNKPGRS